MEDVSFQRSQQHMCGRVGTVGFLEEAPLALELEKETEHMEVEIEGTFPSPNHMKQKIIGP